MKKPKPKPKPTQVVDEQSYEDAVQDFLISLFCED